MCVCVCVYVCVYVCCVCVCVFLCFFFVCVCVCVRVRTCACGFTWLRVCVNSMHVCVHICVCLHSCAHCGVYSSSAFWLMLALFCRHEFQAVIRLLRELFDGQLTLKQKLEDRWRQMNASINLIMLGDLMTKGGCTCICL